MLTESTAPVHTVDVPLFIRAERQMQEFESAAIAYGIELALSVGTPDDARKKEAEQRFLAARRAAKNTIWYHM